MLHWIPRTRRDKPENLSSDFFTRVTAEGLLAWMASEAELARGVFGAHPANAAGGVYGRQIATYFEGQATWRSAIEELAYADRLCYAIEGDRLLRLWSADGEGGFFDGGAAERDGGGVVAGAGVGEDHRIIGSYGDMRGRPRKEGVGAF